MEKKKREKEKEVSNLSKNLIGINITTTCYLNFHQQPYYEIINYKPQSKNQRV
jgi:hypothetical protein